MQLLDLKTKDLWSGKFTELKSKLEELEVQKCIHIAQHKWTALKEIPRVEALIFGAWNSLPECYCEQVVLPLGRGFGGSSIFNGMVYSRGNRKNYNDWAEQGAVGWSYEEVFPYFLKMEDNRDFEYLANGFHSVGGPMSIEKPRYHSEIKDAIFEAVEELGYEVVDPNGAQQTGFYDFQSFLKDGQRCNTAEAYLVPAENRTNLHILGNARVRKIIMDGVQAAGVQFDHKGSTYEIKARREVIMAAGAVNTAQLLMLSGIGPKDHLEKLNIPVVVDLPVGNNLQDHWVVLLNYEIDPRIPTVE
ncbi:Glucose dehydrogenase [FAD, quinone] [Araneus ventricosus]|uniref:Glucose dehydrogenase [FAD, quinone] n=1 Tax=Araneus ventricosus TaxID=182803 RepID=A0A4Y2H9K5_ARAVE|nr:Glucose dehydrogenase [FAD, quinone] [Araneus ventricosus]